MRLRVRILLLEGGERIPLLVAGDGTPLFLPAVWLTTMRRALNRAMATLYADLSALKLLYDWAEHQAIHLDDRILNGEYLVQSELSCLFDCARNPMKGSENLEGRSTGTSVRLISKHRNFERPQPARKCVGSQTTANRLHSIADYLRWLSQEGFVGLPSVEVESRIRARDAMIQTLLIKTPRSHNRSQVGIREGPSEQTIDLLLDVIDVDSPANPWGDLGLRVRNRLLLSLLFGLGLRRGEILGLKIDAIDFRRNRLLIARAADDPIDPRKYQPLAKTRDRYLGFKDSLAEMMEEYITQIRSKIVGARRHPFLFVSHSSGAPLALVSMNKMVRMLRERVPQLPSNLTPHVLRHAWNDAFSRLVDRKAISPAREQQLRSELMGWSPTSGQALTYTRRHTRALAEEMSLVHQEALMKR